MELWLCIAVGVLLVLLGALYLKLRLMQKSADELRRAFVEKLAGNTNTLIDVSGHDRHMLLLADAVNTQLRQLRAERQRFAQGDTELKQAVTNITHDLRTPLTAVAGYLQLLERERKSDAVSRYLGLIGNRVQALRTLTEELFQYSVLCAQSEPCPEPVDVRAVLEESLAAAYGLLTQRGIVPAITLPDKKVERLLDRSALSRIFENIISNAVKYSDGDFRVELDETGAMVFSNTARSLDPVAVGRLFDRFYTVETGRGSTGLGLSIAKLLTERMGGGISAELRGTTLRILLCFAPDAGHGTQHTGG